VGGGTVCREPYGVEGLGVELIRESTRSLTSFLDDEIGYFVQHGLEEVGGREGRNWTDF
jgi:hypothetical protein